MPTDDEIAKAMSRGVDVQKQSSDLLGARELVLIEVRHVKSNAGPGGVGSHRFDPTDPEAAKEAIEWVQSEVDGIVKAANG